MILNKSELQILGEFTSDYAGRVYGRKIASKLRLNQKTVSNALNNLERENILKFTMEGKNKYYFLNRHNPAAKEIIKIAEICKKNSFLQKYSRLSKLIGQAEKKVKGMLIIFGSYADFSANKESDIDFFIIGKSSHMRDLEDSYGIKINIIKSTMKKFSAKEPIIKEVLRNHIILKGVEDFIELAW